MPLKMIKAQTSMMRGRLKPPVKLADPFYLTHDWKVFAVDIKRQRGFKCESCGGDFTHRRNKLIADHIVERKDGGADFDPLNIQCICIYCHNSKTAKARAEREGASEV